MRNFVVGNARPPSLSAIQESGSQSLEAMTSFTGNPAADLAALLATVQRPGDFVASGTADLPVSLIVVESVGSVALPLLPAQAEQSIAAAERAPYGLGPLTPLSSRFSSTGVPRGCSMRPYPAIRARWFCLLWLSCSTVASWRRSSGCAMTRWRICARSLPCAALRRKGVYFGWKKDWRRRGASLKRPNA